MLDNQTVDWNNHASLFLTGGSFSTVDTVRRTVCMVRRCSACPVITPLSMRGTTNAFINKTCKQNDGDNLKAKPKIELLLKATRQLYYRFVHTRTTNGKADFAMISNTK